WGQTRRVASRQLAAEASALEPFVTIDLVGPRRAGRTGTVHVTKRVAVARRALKLADASTIIVTANGRIASGHVPDGVDADEVVATTTTTGPRSGINGRLAWGAASGKAGPNGNRVVVVLTRDVPVVPGALRWVAISALVAVVLAVIAAAVTARRLTGPLAEITAATGRIAAGDLDVRVGDLGPDADHESVALAASIDHMAASLAGARGAQRDFLMSISHDLRTPLTSMRGYAEAIVDGAAPDPIMAAQVILGESTRLERLVADVLDLARMEAHQFSFEQMPVDVAAVASRAVAAFAPIATDAGIAISAGDVSEAVYAVVDPDRLRQVFANLIENALKFAAREVRVDTSRDDDRVRVAVIDDGPGIAPDDLPHVFDRSFSARAVPDAARSRPRGSGLGLAISRELVIAMGGSIDAAAGTQGRGTVMTVSFPVATFDTPTG
ncbi:MAG: HAMP domain-containing histidine kinase, partial [Actinobacteria bacterium]|nr:HAMP domain-containing histidine kinase [Actinomycetota bacterium]